MDTLDKIEEYLASVEEYFFSSLSAVAHGLPDVHEVANRLWIDISRYGPGLPAFPEVHIPSLGDFQVPPPPPPPPAPPATRWLEKSSDWIAKHPWKTTGIVVSAVGTSLLVGYGITHTRRRGHQRLRAQQTKSTDRRQVVGELQIRSKCYIGTHHSISSCFGRRFTFWAAIDFGSGEERIYCDC